MRQAHPDGADGYLLQPDLAGAWKLAASVDDGDGGTGQDELPICVEADQPPCLAALDPMVPPGALVIVEQQGGARRFSVETVTDDLDPYPAPGGVTDPDLGSPHFRWSLGPAGAAPALLDATDVPDFQLDPAASAPGTQLALRVEVVDRRGIWPTCSATQATCGAGGDTCLQRFTWTVEVR
jgi:hypothetical protein